MTVTARALRSGPRHASTTARRTSAWTTVGRGAAVRMAILPVSAILGIINTRLIIDHFGQSSFAQYGLLVGMGSLIPFADLGISAAIVNAIAQSDDVPNDEHVRRIVTTALRVLTGSATIILLLTGVITLTGSWPTLLGDGLQSHTGPTAAALCLALFACGLLVGFGQQILSGLGKNHVTIAILGLQTPAVLFTLSLIITFDSHLGAYIAAVPYGTTFLISLLATYVAARKIRPIVGRAIRDAPRIRTVKGGKVFGVAWPMLIQMIALPIAMQTDRLVLSHVSDPANLARYNLSFQIFNPVWQVASSAGVALWPIFAKARARGAKSSISPLSMSVGFGGVAAVTCLALSLASGWLTGRASGGSIHIGIGLMIAFSLFMISQAAKYPLGMYMTDAAGLRYQAFMILVFLLPVNFGLSWVLALHLGAVGPVIGSAVGVSLFQLVANWRYVRRDLERRERHDRLRADYAIAD